MAHELDTSQRIVYISKWTYEQSVDNEKYLLSSRPSCRQLHHATIRAAVKPNVGIDSEGLSGKLRYMLVLLD